VSEKLDENMEVVEIIRFERMKRDHVIVA